jgi:lipase maturation factor 1
MGEFVAALKWVFGPEVASAGKPGHFWARWIFLRALGLIYFSAFYSLLFQIKGLIGPDGILPAGNYLQAVSGAYQTERFWFAPTLLWFGSSNHALMLLCWAGLIASLLVVLNVWPRATLAVCLVCFLSFVTAAQEFSSYQSDGMLMEAGFISLFFAPAGLWPGLGFASAPSRLSRFLLRWEWLRIYFQSGAGKILGHDPTWRNFTAMDNYYQNGPLPTWIGWYVQHLPHWFHAFAVVYTFAAELFLVWMMFLPRRFRIACFLILAPFQISIILTANYAFLNYIVFMLGFLLLDDQFVEWIVPHRIREIVERKPPQTAAVAPKSAENGFAGFWRSLKPVGTALSSTCLVLMLYASTMQLVWMFAPRLDLPRGPVGWLEPFRVVDRYGLFERMTPARYEIEFQGSLDGKIWTAYPFRYKPQDTNRAPGIYAPYQPRFDWNLWFASLGNWHEYHFVLWTEERLLKNSPDVLELFAANPFANSQPRQVRAVIYQYWFTDLKTKRETGQWWRRELLGAYAPELDLQPDGKVYELYVPIAQQPEL